MKKIKLTKVGKITSCLAVMALLFGGLLYINTSFDNDIPKKDYDYVGNINLDSFEPVVSTMPSNLLIRPYLNTSVKIVKDFYDYQDSEEEQVDSIIYYESTYMPNFSVAYGMSEGDFEVVSILDGVVLSIEEDSLLGTIIEIQHDNNIVSVYQSVSQVKVEESQVVKQGDVIALSGYSNLNKELKSHLMFELLLDGKIVNPEDYYNKSIDEI